MQSFGDRKRLIERDREIHVARETLLRFGHELPNTLCCFDCVRARQLVTGDDRRGLAVQAAFYVVGLRAEIDPRDVFHAHKRAIGICAHDNLTEFLRCL